MAKIKVGGSVTKTKPKKPKTKRITSVTIRENKGKDLSPSWEGQELWSSLEFTKKYHDAMQYYNLEYSGKDLKPQIIKWMISEELEPRIIELFKKTKDWRCSVVMGAIASCLLKGMPAIRPDFNNGKDSKEWLIGRINDVLTQGSDDIADEDEKQKSTSSITIQDRLRETAIAMSADIDDAIEQFYQNSNFDFKSINVLNNLKSKDVKAAHARIIQSFYINDLNEIESVLSKSADDDLKEAYSNRPKKQLQQLVGFYKEIMDSCNMLSQESKVNRKPRTKKPVAKDKLVSKLKYKKTDESLKLVSINPVDIINSKELWCFDTKTRKLYRYTADEMEGPLTIKGTSIVGFDTAKSVGKTLRKPTDQLAEFKKAGKVALRSFLDEINAVEVKANGRINENQVLLKAS